LFYDMDGIDKIQFATQWHIRDKWFWDDGPRIDEICSDIQGIGPLRYISRVTSEQTVVGRYKMKFGRQKSPPEGLHFRMEVVTRWVSHSRQ
jgi:hypothetical protein